jgi:replicative DNA helicase
MELAKIPPQNIEAEIAVLGACILENKALYEIVDVLTPEMFYDTKHQIVFQRLLEMFKSGENIDLLTIVNCLREHNELERVGGAVAINQLTNRIISSANIEAHAAIVREAWMKRSFIALANNLLQKGYNEAEEVGSLIEYSDKELFNISNYFFGKNRIEHLAYYVNQAAEETQNKIKANREGITAGIPTGLHDLDLGLNGGFQTGLYILAARPGMGKSSVMLKFAKSAVKGGYIPLIFSLEMTATELSHRLILSELDESVEVMKYKNGWLKDADMGKLTYATLAAKNMNMYIDDNAGVSYSYIKSVVYKKKKQGLCDCVFIDYLQIMDIPQAKGQTKDDAIGVVTRQLFNLGKELDIPIIALSQLNRGVELRADKRPQLSDLRESGNIEQDANVVMFIYRPEYYDKTAPKGEGVIIRAKNRNGSLGDSNFYYNESLTKIYDHPQGFNPPQAIINNEEEIF